MREKRLCDAETLFHPMGVCLYLVERSLFQTDQLEHLEDALAGRTAVQRADDFKVFVCREVQIEIRLFDDSSDGSQRFLTLPPQRMPEEEDVPFRRIDEGEKHADGRALAGAVGTKEAEYIATTDLEAKVSDSPSLARRIQSRPEQLAKSVRLEDGFAGQELPRIERKQVSCRDKSASM